MVHDTHGFYSKSHFAAKITRKNVHLTVSDEKSGRMLY